MKSHYSTYELEQLKLPGLPGSRRGIEKAAKRDRWPSRPREEQGGGEEYPVTALPPAARRALMRLVDPASPPPNAPPALPAERPAAPGPRAVADWQRRVADARVVLLMEIDRRTVFEGSGNKAIATLVAEAEDGILPAHLAAIPAKANARSGGQDGSRTLSERTLKRWRADYKKGGWEALLPRETAAAPVWPAWGDALLKLWRVPTKRSLRAVMEDLPATLPAGVEMPGYGQARHFLSALSPQERERGRMGPNALLAIKGAKRRDCSTVNPLDLVMADGHSLKARVAHPIHGQPFKPEVCSVKDARTKRVVGWAAGLAESAAVVLDAYSHAVRMAGMIAVTYTDNGSGFVADVMTDEALGHLARMGITPINATPGRAQARGPIEKVQADLWIRSAKKLPTYVGRDMDREAGRRVAERLERDFKASGSSRLLLSWEEFLAWAQAEVDAYNRRPNRGLPKVRDAVTGKMRHQTPDEAWEECLGEGWRPEFLSDAQLADVFRPYEWRTTTRGEVRLPWGRYFSSKLEAFHGERVQVGYDIHDGSTVWVRNGEGQLICIAERDANVIEALPESKKQHALEARARGQRKRLEQHLADVEAQLLPTASIIDGEAEGDAPVVLTAEQLAMFEPDILTPTPQPPALIAPNGRPVFTDGFEKAVWLWEHPTEITETDRAWLARELRNSGFRMAAEVCTGLTLAQIGSLTSPPPTAHSPEGEQP